MFQSPVIIQKFTTGHFKFNLCFDSLVSQAARNSATTESPHRQSYSCFSPPLFKATPILSPLISQRKPVTIESSLSNSAGGFPFGSQNAKFCNRQVHWVLLLWNCTKDSLFTSQGKKKTMCAYTPIKTLSLTLQGQRCWEQQWGGAQMFPAGKIFFLIFHS